MSLISGNGNRIILSDNASTGNSSTANNPRDKNASQEGFITSTDKNVTVPNFGLNSSGTSSKNVLKIDLAGRLQDDIENSNTDSGQEAADKVPLSLDYQSSFAGASPMRNKSISNQPKGSTAIDEAKSKENILYLAKSFKPQTSILPPKPQTRSDQSTSEKPVCAAPTTTNVIPARATTPSRNVVPPNASAPSRAAPSSEHHNQPTSRSAPSYEHQTPSSSSAGRPRRDYSLVKFDPVPFPPAREPIESSRTHVSQYDVGEYFTKAITEDRGDGNGYGRRIHLPPVFDPDYFLGDREGVVNALKRFSDEERRMREDEDKTVGHLIEKFQEISPSDYNMIIHRFGFDKIYSISDSVLHIYHPYPSPNSPFKDKRMEEIIEIIVEEDDDDKDAAPKEKSYTVDGALQNVSVSGLKREHENTERDHVGPSSSRQSSVKQIAREKRFCHELFLPLLNAKLKPEMIEFIKEEVTMQLNLKICDLYDDPELLISDKETFEKALAAYLRSEKLIKQLQEARDSLVAFVKENT